MKISGYVCATNAIRLDYMLSESARSLVPACDEVVLCIGPSDDGTRELAELLCAEDDRFRIVDYPHPIPVREITWWTTFLNFARRHLRYPLQLTLVTMMEARGRSDTAKAMLKIFRDAQVRDGQNG